MTKYDIIIVGGGMVGATLACALQQLPYRVALIDATPASSSTDHRLIALTYHSCCLFQHLNIWPILQKHATPIKQIHVSHRGHFGITRIRAEELTLSTLGYLIPAKYINAALDEKLNPLATPFEKGEKEGFIDIIRPAQLKNLTQTSDNISLQVEIDSKTIELQTRILIGADGTHSTVRQLIDIPIKTLDYDQSAIVTTTELHRHHHHVAYERFLEQGAIAMLPLSDKSCATIWTTNNEKVSDLMRLTDEQFIAELQTTFGYRLGRFSKIHRRYTYPLKMVLAEHYQQNNILLIGNAAHTLHPIASQGLNLALYEIAELIEHLHHIPHPHELSLAGLSKTHSQQDNSINLTHQLTWLFSTDVFMLNIARQLGMVGLDACKQAKQFFMKKSMGRSGKMPYLLQEKDHHENQHFGH